MTDKHIWLHWNMDDKEITDKTKKLIKKSIENNKNLLRTNITSSSSFYKALSILSNDIYETSSYHSMCSFIKFVSPNSKVRSSSNNADYALTKYISKLNTNQSIYSKVMEMFNYGKINKLIDDQDTFFLKKIIDGYEKNGVNLDRNNMELFVKIQLEISKIEKIIFGSMMNSNEKYIDVSKNDLIGLPISVLKRLQIINSKYRIQLNPQNYNICMRYLASESIRKKIELIYHTNCNNIIDDVLRLFVLRDKLAKLLGHINYAEYRLKDQMLDYNKLKDFLTDFLHKLDNRYNEEIDMIKKLKMQETNDKKPIIHTYDVQYYITKWKKKYGLNDIDVQKYFPVNKTIDEIFRLYRETFNIEINLVEDTFSWHDDVKMYAVYDTCTRGENNRLIGYFYLDLYKREGKYNQIRTFPLQHNSSLSQTKSNCISFSVLLANFTKNSLLNHGEVVIFFREFGNILQQLFSKIKYNSFDHGIAEDDFVQVPAYVLENMCWEKDILKKISSHYETGLPMPDDMIDKLIKIRNLNVGIYYKKQILLSIFDQFVHSSQKFLLSIENIIKDDITNKPYMSKVFSNLYKELHQQIFINNSIEFNEGMIMPMSWNNFVGDTNAKYYSNLWSKVVSSDIYMQMSKKNTSDMVRFKDNIMCYGGDKNANKVLSDYLKRNVSTNGFLQMYQLQNDAEFSFYLNTDQINAESNIQRGGIASHKYMESDDTNDNSCLDTESNKFSECDTDTEYNDETANSIYEDEYKYVKAKFNNDIFIKK